MRDDFSEAKTDDGSGMVTIQLDPNVKVLLGSLTMFIRWIWLEL